MGNKFQSLTVILEEDMTQEDAEVLAKSINSMRNVQSVVVGEPMGDYVARTRVRQELLQEIFALIHKSV